MAPPGVNTFYDLMDVMTISSQHPLSYTITSPPASHFKLSTSTSAASPPSPPGGVVSVSSEHNYVLKLAPASMEPAMSLHEEDTAFFSDDEGKTDALLSSGAYTAGAAGSDDDDVNDTDFLQELDDLYFTLDDLDPCGDVDMEDSFQDFIDSALGKPDSSLDHIEPANSESDTVILNKEDFLGLLQLRSVPERSPCREASGLLSSTRTPLDFSTLSHTHNSLDSAPFGAVPTKMCSCLNNESRAVYSTAHCILQEEVRVCPSTFGAVKKHDTCSNCSLIAPTSADVISPLYIDTAVQPLSEENMDELMDSSSSIADKDDSDLLDWLGDNHHHDRQQQQKQQFKPVTGQCEGNAEADGDMSIRGGSELVTLDLELFDDPDSFSMSSASDDNNNNDEFVVSSPSLQHDHTYQRTDGESISRFSQLKLSFLTELSEHHVIDSGAIRRRRTDSCCDSLGWESTDTSLMSPPLPSNSPSPSIESNVKSQLALLNLFSDENAISLLHTYSASPNIRFI